MFGDSFGGNREKAWRQAAERVGGEYLSVRPQRPETVQLKAVDTTITLDFGKSSEGRTGTRMRAPFMNRSGFRFLVYRTGYWSEVGKRLVMLQDLDVGHPGIDRRFVVQSAQPEVVRDLFRIERVRDVVWNQKKKIRFGISGNEGVLGGKYPDGVELLHFHTPESVVDPERLAEFFDLFRAVLEQVTVPAGEGEVERQIRRLAGPGGIITGRVTLWEGGPPRHDAIDELARLHDPRALPALIEALQDSDPLIQAKAVYALGELRDESAVPHLVRLLGRRQGQFKRKLADDAFDALEVMGRADIGTAFLQALEGDPSELAVVSKEFRPEVIDALILALEGPGRLPVSNTVQALAKLGAMEALPELRSRAKTVVLSSVREVYQEAIAALEARTSLPRPAASEAFVSGGLPKPATHQDHGPGDTLPMASELDSPT